MPAPQALRLIADGVQPGDRVALIAETGADFAAAFFAAIYAGALPVPLPLPTSFGGRDSYIEQIATQLRSCDPKLVLCARRPVPDGRGSGRGPVRRA